MNTNTLKSLVKLNDAANKGDLNAQCAIADFYLSRETEEGNIAAIPRLRKAAKQNDSWAQYQLGLAYQEGLGVSKNIAKAIHFYKLSALQGFDSAQLNLGIILANLRGKKRNLKEAVRLYHLAAKQNNKNACYNLGFYYEIGHGVKQSNQKSFTWYLSCSTG